MSSGAKILTAGAVTKFIPNRRVVILSLYSGAVISYILRR